MPQPSSATGGLDGTAEASVFVDVLVVGAGFAGLHLLHSLRERGVVCKVVEAGNDVGGVWFWNRYPGARCDVESIEYSYSFSEKVQASWSWSERFATQQELHSYARYVADELDLRRDITFNTRVTAALYDEASDSWTVSTDDGGELRCRFFVLATGVLSEPKVPDIRGLASFRGEIIHTCRWPEPAPDLSDKRVGVVGTGSTGVQLIPLVAEAAKELTVFQRTPAFVVPARNKPLAPGEMDDVKHRYPELRQVVRESRTGYLFTPPQFSALEVTAEEREELYERAWQRGGAEFLVTFNDLRTNAQANQTAADFVRAKIASIVDDATTAETLTPRTYPIGAKRICVGTDYYETFNRPNVRLVDINKSPNLRVTSDGIDLADRHVDLDVLIVATGFDAMTGSILAIDIRGRGGAKLREKWAAGPRNYLGFMVADFPNMFTICGPGSPSVMSNMIVSIEQHVEMAVTFIENSYDEGWTAIEPAPEAEEHWTAHVADLASQTLLTSAASWYMGANIPGKPRVFMPYPNGTLAYRQAVEKAIENGFEGFIRSS